MAKVPRASPKLVAVEINDWVNVGVAPFALVERQTPPSPAALNPFCQTMRVFPVASPGSKTISLILRLPVHGVSKHPPLVDTVILVARTPAAGPVTLTNL